MAEVDGGTWKLKGMLPRKEYIIQPKRSKKRKAHKLKKVDKINTPQKSRTTSAPCPTQ